MQSELEHAFRSVILLNNIGTSFCGRGFYAEALEVFQDGIYAMQLFAKVMKGYDCDRIPSSKLFNEYAFTLVQTKAKLAAKKLAACAASTPQDQRRVNVQSPFPVEIFPFDPLTTMNLESLKKPLQDQALLLRIEVQHHMGVDGPSQFDLDVHSAVLILNFGVCRCLFFGVGSPWTFPHNYSIFSACTNLLLKRAGKCDKECEKASLLVATVLIIKSIIQAVRLINKSDSIASLYMERFRKLQSNLAELEASEWYQLYFRSPAACAA